LKVKSIWNENIKIDNYSKLNKDIDVDVLIIGGGITGVSTAYHLKESDLKVCLVEKNKVASGVSSKTTGKLTYLQNLIYSKLYENYSLDVVKKYYESQKDAIKIVDKIIKDNQIECNFVNQKSYLFANLQSDIEKVKKEQEILEKIGVKVKKDKIPMNINNYYSISVNDTAYFHPVKYIINLAKICFNNGIDIYENTNVVDIRKDTDNYICYTDNYKIRTKKVVIACHYPFFIIPFLFPFKGHLERSYLSATKVSENQNISGISASKYTKSFRYHTDNSNNFLLFLSNSHNLAFKYNVKENFNNMLIDLNKLNLTPDYIWSNEDIITNDYLPYIGMLQENLYLATGYNTWGMTNGSIAGKIINDLILSKKNKYSSLFDPKRIMPISNIGSTCYNIFSSTKPFIENKIIKNKSFYSNKVIFTKKNGQNIAIYIDSNNKKHIVYNRCPHLKCSLIFNEVELTWDCPCHSSRFDIDGNVIKGPSCYNIKYKE